MTCPQIISLACDENMLWLACSRIHQRLAEKESAHTFQIISPLIGQTALNYPRCAMQGVIMTIRKMVTLRLAHLPSILMNCIFSLLSCCSLSPAGVVNPPVSTAGKHPRLVCCGWKVHIPPPPSSFFKYFSKTKKKKKKSRKQKAGDNHNKVNAWHFTQTKIFDIQEQLKDPETRYIHVWARIFLFLSKAKPRSECLWGKLFSGFKDKKRW